MKYYFEEHENTYQEMKRDNILAWDQYHEPAKYNFDHFMMRSFLERALDIIQIFPDKSKAFEYGCGTGAGACFLAKRGFVVDAIDISPTAIELARSIAEERNLNINYSNRDLLELTEIDQEYDLILDNYCLQSIVTDCDRLKLYSLIKSAMKKNGYYIISTAIYNGNRVYSGDTYYCEETGVVYDRVTFSEQYPDAIFLNQSWWIPNRRHLRKEDLREELLAAGFIVLFQEEGNVICSK
ncbi:MAG: methyltransferase protein [Paenibacillaceae bacterium]|nr:methyltransferase protein [Paenibacillaceae bacterium]